MTAIFAFLAFLLATLTGHPGPTVAATVPAHVGARPAGPFESAPLAARPQGSQRETGSRGSNPQAPTSPAPRTYFPQPLTTPVPFPAPALPTGGPELQGPMCTDPIDCPTS